VLLQLGAFTKGRYVKYMIFSFTVHVLFQTTCNAKVARLGQDFTTADVTEPPLIAAAGYQRVVQYIVFRYHISRLSYVSSYVLRAGAIKLSPLTVQPA